MPVLTNSFLNRESPMWFALQRFRDLGEIGRGSTCNVRVRTLLVSGWPPESGRRFCSRRVSWLIWACLLVTSNCERDNTSSTVHLRHSTPGLSGPEEASLIHPPEWGPLSVTGVILSTIVGFSAWALLLLVAQFLACTIGQSVFELY